MKKTDFLKATTDKDCNLDQTIDNTKTFEVFIKTPIGNMHTEITIKENATENEILTLASKTLVTEYQQAKMTSDESHFYVQLDYCEVIIEDVATEDAADETFYDALKNYSKLDFYRDISPNPKSTEKKYTPTLLVN